MRETISAVVITRNEEAEIADCLAALRWADEIVVMDSESTDRTVEIARGIADRVELRPFSGFTDQKRAVTEIARGPWILNVDADERVGPELRDEILALLERGPDRNGYTVPRLTWYLGRFIRHGGWYPDRKLRLFRKERAEWIGGMVHESVRVDGPTGELIHPLLHYSFRALDDHRATIERFTRLGAEDLAKRGRGGRLFDIVLRPPAAFLKFYLLRAGFLDGWRGLLIALFSARHTGLKHLRARRLRRAKGARRGEKS
ncbi:MAG: glycosyltransferase family 2 protein [Candidatus Eisenbacteria bacterium]|nr:glycosyltransferase family 2 protein [Candidatus Eisenbacteria bacterium]